MGFTGSPTNREDYETRRRAHAGPAGYLCAVHEAAVSGRVPLLTILHATVELFSEAVRAEVKERWQSPECPRHALLDGALEGLLTHASKRKSVISMLEG